MFDLKVCVCVWVGEGSTFRTKHLQVAVGTIRLFIILKIQIHCLILLIHVYHFSFLFFKLLHVYIFYFYTHCPHIPQHVVQASAVCCTFDTRQRGRSSLPKDLFFSPAPQHNDSCFYRYFTKKKEEFSVCMRSLCTH